MAVPVVLAFRGDEAVEINLHYVVIAESQGDAGITFPSLPSAGFYAKMI